MAHRPPRCRALLICALFLAAEIFAFAPQLHAHAAGGAGRAAAAATADAMRMAGSGAWTGAASAPRHLHVLRAADPPAGARHVPEQCPACRIASLVVVAPGGPPLALPLPRAAAGAVAPAQRRCWLSLDSTFGRAPPRA